MAMLRTRRLTAGKLQAVRDWDLTIYTPAAGIRAILRDVRIGNDTATPAAFVVLYIRIDSTNHWILSESVEVNAVLGRTMDVVLNPGDKLNLASDVAVAYVLSGAELVIPA